MLIIYILIIFLIIKIFIKFYKSFNVYKSNKCENKKICLLKKQKIICFFCKSYIETRRNNGINRNKMAWRKK